MYRKPDFPIHVLGLEAKNSTLGAGIGIQNVKFVKQIIDLLIKSVGGAGGGTLSADGALPMRYNPEIHRRRSIRLKGYDYGQAGLYCITICAWQRQCIFGAIANGEMQLGPLGTIARDEWLRTAELRPHIALAEFVVMPNHLHGIIVMGDMDGGMAIAADNKLTVNGRGTPPRALPDAPPCALPDAGGDASRGTRRRALPGEWTQGMQGMVGGDAGDEGTRRRAPTGDGSQGRQMPRGVEAFGKPTSNTISAIARGYKAAVTKQINIVRNAPGCPVWQRNYYEHVIRSEADYLRIAAYILDNPRRWQEDSLNDG
jgi:putative transposase